MTPAEARDTQPALLDEPSAPRAAPYRIEPDPQAIAKPPDPLLNIGAFLLPTFGMFVEVMLHARITGGRAGASDNWMTAFIFTQIVAGTLLPALARRLRCTRRVQSAVGSYAIGGCLSPLVIVILSLPIMLLLAALQLAVQWVRSL